MRLERLHKAPVVYGINRELPLNHVLRDTADSVLVESLTRDKHIVIYGSSKQGKTSLRKHCLNDDDYIVVHCSNKWSLGDLHSAILKRAGFEVTQSKTLSSNGKNKIIATIGSSLGLVSASVKVAEESSASSAVTTIPLELDSEDVNDIIKALADFNKYIVLEDFHYLSIETQKDFAVALKAFHEQSLICFIIVGVWLEESRLSVYNGDLTGRLIGINADRWSEPELEKVIGEGEALLNIQFSQPFKNELLNASLESVYIVQEACYQACAESNVHHTQDNLIQLGDDIDVSKIVRDVVNQQTGRYHSFITQFAAGFQDTTLEMYKWLLYPIITSSSEKLESGISYREIREILSQNHPEGSNLNPGNLTQALQYIASLQAKKISSQLC